MGATYNFSLGFAQGTESKAETPDRLLKRQPLQEICTGMSLVSLCLGFSVFGMLIIVNRHQADPNGLSGESFVATAGGLGAILVGMAFLGTACLHWSAPSSFFKRVCSSDWQLARYDPYLFSVIAHSSSSSSSAVFRLVGAKLPSLAFSVQLSSILA